MLPPAGFPPLPYIRTVRTSLIAGSAVFMHYCATDSALIARRHKIKRIDSRAENRQNNEVEKVDSMTFCVFVLREAQIMRTTLLVLLAASAMVLAGCASGESYVKPGFEFAQIEEVAVVDVQGDVRNEAVKNQIADFFNMELLKKGYTPVERAHIQTLLKEQEFQSSEMTSQVGMAKAGEILNVPAVMMVSIPNFGEEISVTAKMVDVQSGSILWMGTGEGNTGRTLGTIFGAAAGAAAGAAVSGRDDRVIGGVAGGVMGGVAGRALSPQKAKKVKEVVGKICKSLPQRTAGK